MSSASTPQPSHTDIRVPPAPDLYERGGRGYALGLLITAGLFAIAWYNTFYEMWQRWFPAWQRTDAGLTLTQRLTEGDSYYSHGPLVPLVSLIIAYYIHKRVGAPASNSVPNWFAGLVLTGVALAMAAVGWVFQRGEIELLGWGIVTFAGLQLAVIGVWFAMRRGGSFSSLIAGGVILAAFLVLHVMSVYARVTFVSGFALIGALLGLLVLWGGWPMLRAYWLPVAFLLFMVPLPMDWIAKINFQLKFFAGAQALWLTTHVFGVPAVLDGSFVYFPNAPDGSAKVLVIENVCSGLRSLISLICFASLFALICRCRGFWRLFMLALAVPVAIACNVARITFLNLIAHHYSVADAGPGALAHDLSGLVVFALALAFLFCIERLIIAGGKLFKLNWYDERLLAYLEGVKTDARCTPRTMRPVALVGFAIVAALSVWWSQLAPGQNIGKEASKAVPSTVTINGVKYVSEDLELDRLTLTILETDDYLYRRFRSTESRGGFDLLIVFSANNRKGTHPPEVCLEGGGEQVVDKRIVAINTSSHAELRLRGLTTQRGTTMTEHVYTYKCGAKYTPSFIEQQFQIFVNGLFSRNTAGALIRFTASSNANDPQAAREYLRAVAEELMPSVDKGLP